MKKIITKMMIAAMLGLFTANIAAVPYGTVVYAAEQSDDKDAPAPPADKGNSDHNSHH